MSCDRTEAGLLSPRVRLFALAVMCLWARPAAGARNWKLMGRLDLMAGQYYFQGNAGALNGFTDVDLQLARSLSPSSGFYVSGRSIYTGFKQVNELAGGGTLFQQSLDNSLGFKWIRRFEGGYSLKPRVGVRQQLFRETQDEAWGKGLYDLWRYEAGLVWERRTRLGLSVPWTWQLSWDAYYTRYVRFKTLASQFGAETGAPDPGSRILDTATNQLGWRNELEFPGFASGILQYSVSLVRFTDQKVVDPTGRFTNSRRFDVYQNLALSLSKRLLDFHIYDGLTKRALTRVRPAIGAGLSFASLLSNQDHFETNPKRLKFIEGYYDYWEVRGGPNAGATFLPAMTGVRVGYEIAARLYTGRLAQSPEGAYQDRRLWQRTQTVSLEFTQPVVAGLDLKARGTWSETRSNTSFEQTYRYNYSDYNYFAGVEWRF